MEVWREERRGLGQLRLAVALARGHGGTRERRTASGSDCWASASAKSLAVGGEGSLLNETEHGGGAVRAGEEGNKGRGGGLVEPQSALWAGVASLGTVFSRYGTGRGEGREAKAAQRLGIDQNAASGSSAASSRIKPRPKRGGPPLTHQPLPTLHPKQ